MHQGRRQFLQQSLLLSGLSLIDFTLLSCSAPGNKIMTVNGEISADNLGLTLCHEHVMVDFIGASQITSGRYNPDEVYRVVLPYIMQLKSYGCKSFIDCTPSWLGRDVKLLKRLSEESGMHFITNTGFYGAAGEKFLPSIVQTGSAEEIAEIWINESRNGIDDAGIRPGFMKLGVDNLPFSSSILKIIHAGAITHHKTGLPIGIHTSGGGKPAMEELRLLTEYGVNPGAWIWIHAQIEKDNSYHIGAAKKGAWISFDGINTDNSEEYINHLTAMKQQKILNRVLISQDAGWYNVGDAGGGKFRDYNALFTTFIPALQKAGFTKEEIQLMLVENPSKAYSISPVKA